MCVTYMYTHRSLGRERLRREGRRKGRREGGREEGGRQTDRQKDRKEAGRLLAHQHRGGGHLGIAHGG